jgi:hypothetical protein
MTPSHPRLAKHAETALPALRRLTHVETGTDARNRAVQAASSPHPAFSFVAISGRPLSGARLHRDPKQEPAIRARRSS